MRDRKGLQVLEVKGDSMFKGVYDELRLPVSGDVKCSAELCEVRLLKVP